jgi:hypothetical protein
MPSNVVRLFDDEPSVAPGRFDELWKLWPRKDGKAVARAMYAGIVRGRFQTKTLD